MGDRATSLAKARRELEDMYLGIPDDSVNLTFQDLAEVKNVKHHPFSSSSDKKNPPSPPKMMDPISECAPTTPQREFKSPCAPPTPHREFKSPSTSNRNMMDATHALSKIPSLDFSRGLAASSAGRHNHHRVAEEVLHEKRGHGFNYDDPYGHDHHVHHHDGGMMRHGIMESSMAYAYDDMSMMSGMASMNPYNNIDRGGRRRPGIPHSNICTVCSVYVYILRHRCLVCGRVYCRQCVNIGMGDMAEGRKCVECLGRKFSQRYIHRAGAIGCWSSFCLGYPRTVKLQELKWAEKGPRRIGENRFGPDPMISRLRSPMVSPRATTGPANGPSSFVANSQYSPYNTPPHHHIPL